MTSMEHGAPAARSEPRPFIGREHELDELEALLGRAIDGHGELVLLVGEAGIGKSALAERLGARAAERGAAVLRGRCCEEGGAPAYWPWVQIVRALVEETEPSALAAVMGTSAMRLSISMISEAELPFIASARQPVRPERYAVAMPDPR